MVDLLSATDEATPSFALRTGSHEETLQQVHSRGVPTRHSLKLCVAVGEGGRDSLSLSPSHSDRYTELAMQEDIPNVLLDMSAEVYIHVPVWVLFNSPSSLCRPLSHQPYLRG